VLLTSVWSVVAIVLVVQLPDASRLLAQLSLLYVVYYVGASLVLTARRRRAAAPGR
jgi:hypothetical protein